MAKVEDGSFFRSLDSSHSMSSFTAGFIQYVIVIVFFTTLGILFGDLIGDGSVDPPLYQGNYLHDRVASYHFPLSSIRGD